MSETKRYDGPVRVGMKFRSTGLTDELVVQDYMSDEIADETSEYMTGLRSRWYPVRPADDDRAAWELFLPDGPVEDTGPKTFKVGQVWALGYPMMGYMVGLITGQYNGNRDAFSFKRLAGDYSDRLEYVTNGCFVSRAATLLFDAPESTAKPAPAEPARVAMGVTERKLAEGWEQRAFQGGCTMYLGPGKVSCRAAAVYDSFSRASCEAHAEAQGVFAKDEPFDGPSIVEAVRPMQKQLDAIPGTDLRDAIWGGVKAAERVYARTGYQPIDVDKSRTVFRGLRITSTAVDETTSFTEADWHKLTRIMQCKACTHIHDIGKPCNGTSPNGEYSCPCGHARVEAKRVRAVGTYGATDDARLRKQMDWRDGIVENLAYQDPKASKALLANLERERVPRRELVVARRYWPGANLDGSEP